MTGIYNAAKILFNEHCTDNTVSLLHDDIPQARATMPLASVQCQGYPTRGGV